MTVTDQHDSPIAKPGATVGVADIPNASGEQAAGLAGHELRDLKGKTARGALVSTISQGANFALRIGSMVVLARILTPSDFGLVGMVTAFTGFLGLFRDAGLSMATVQRA